MFEDIITANNLFYIAIGLGAALVVANLENIVTGLGLFAYNGLSMEQVMKVASLMDKRADILSRVQGGDGVNHIWYRGVYFGKAAAYPIYYRYDLYPKQGKADYRLYPMVYERFSTQPDLFGTSGTAVYP